MFDFILEAVHLVANEGWRMLPYYRFEPESGLWRHRTPPEHPPMSLHDIGYHTGAMRYPSHRSTDADTRLADYLADAKALFAQVAAGPRPEPFGPPDVTADFEELRWFPLPDEATPPE